MSPSFQIIEDRFCKRLFLHGIEFHNPPDGFFSDSIALLGKNILALGADIGHAGHLVGLVLSEQAEEAGVSIGMNEIPMLWMRFCKSWLSLMGSRIRNAPTNQSFVTLQDMAIASKTAWGINLFHLTRLDGPRGLDAHICMK